MQDFVDKLPDFLKPWGNEILLNPFNFEGRTNRKDFWMTVLVNIIVSAILSIIPFVGWILSLILSVCSIALCIRRLNDIGKGWPYIFFAFIPCVGGFILIYFYCQDSVA